MRLWTSRELTFHSPGRLRRRERGHHRYVLWSHHLVQLAQFVSLISFHCRRSASNWVLDVDFIPACRLDERKDVGSVSGRRSGPLDAQARIDERHVRSWHDRTVWISYQTFHGAAGGTGLRPARHSQSGCHGHKRQDVQKTRARAVCHWPAPLTVPRLAFAVAVSRESRMGTIKRLDAIPPKDPLPKKLGAILPRLGLTVQ